jgi:hypothetical protein
MGLLLDSVKLLDKELRKERALDLARTKFEE